MMDLPPLTLEQAQGLHERPAMIQRVAVPKTAAEYIDTVGAMPESKNSPARLRAVVDSGISVGIKSGMSFHLENIRRAVKANERNLDQVYDFGMLLIHDRVVPPVITEARDIYSQDGNYTLRLSGAHYRIESQARFVSTPPTWRDYLTFPRANISRTDLVANLSPKTEEERKAWKMAVADGWRQGVAQANLILSTAFDRMNRDLSGMLRFHTFVMQGKISLPAIASESIAVTREGATMSVDETLLRIVTLPEFNGRLDTWTASGSLTPAQASTPTHQVAASVPGRSQAEAAVRSSSEMPASPPLVEGQGAPVE